MVLSRKFSEVLKGTPEIYRMLLVFDTEQQALNFFNANQSFYNDLVDNYPNTNVSVSYNYHADGTPTEGEYLTPNKIHVFFTSLHPSNTSGEDKKIGDKRLSNNNAVQIATYLSKVNNWTEENTTNFQNIGNNGLFGLIDGFIKNPFDFKKYWWIYAAIGTTVYLKNNE